MRIENCKLKIVKDYILPVSVFITGACVLIVEVTATRVLSPFFGNTIFTVSGVITVILAALSAGYYFGGRLADKSPSFFWFFNIILMSGFVLLGFYTAGQFVLPVLGSELSLLLGPLASSLLLFFLPAFLLGMLSPYAVKLQKVDFPEQGIGTASGNIFFWSTLGSIAGSLSAGFVLIPNFGVSQVIMGTGIALFFLGFFGFFLFGKKKDLISRFLIFLVILAASFAAMCGARGDVLYSKDGVYEKIIIYDKQYNDQIIRFFQQDRSSSGAMFLNSDDPTNLVYEYTKYYSLYKIFKPDLKNALVIGGGAYSIPKALLYELPEVNVDVSEIEPSLYGLAKEYFDLEDSPRLKTYTEDGRRLLFSSEKQYDLIFSDVYYSLYSIPPHFTTQEFFELAKNRLSKDGIFMANLIGDLSRQTPSLIMSEIKTFQSVFENSYFFAAKSPKIISPQNIIFIGFNGEKKFDFSKPEIVFNSNPIISGLKEKQINVERFDFSPYPVLTDNYAPVEYLTGKMLQRSSEGNSFFDGQEILALIAQQLHYGPRYPTALGHKQVQDFIITEMRTLADRIKTQTWVHSEANGQSYELKNIIAQFYPEKQKRIIVGTHYDSQKISFNNLLDKNQPSPGANNSASGTALLLEFARLLNNAKEKPEVGIDIVFFDGEEGEESQGADFSGWKPLGSVYFTEHLPEIYGGNKPGSGAVLDMICDKNLEILKESSSIDLAPEQTNAFWQIASEVNESVFRNEMTREIRDDHTSLNQAGIPSFLVIDYDYPCWAKTCDSIDKCSAESLETVLEALWNYVHSVNAH